MSDERIKQNWREGKFRHTEFEGHTDAIVTCFQMDSDRIVSGSDDGQLNAYKARDPVSDMF